MPPSQQYACSSNATRRSLPRANEILCFPLDGSLRDFDLREVKVAQTIIAQAREVWLAADHSKFNRPAMVQLADLSQIDRLFTDADPPPPFPELLERAQVRLEIAKA